MLRIIGGFEYPDEGQVLFEGKDIANVPPYKRRVNTVFQKYALFPHLNVFDNIAFGLRLKKIPKDQIAERVKRMLKLVNLCLLYTSGLAEAVQRLPRGVPGSGGRVGLLVQRGTAA